jgi:hypothetical protein
MADKKLSDVTSVEDFDYFLGVKSNGDVQKMSKDSMKKVISELMSSFLQINSPKNFIVSNPSNMETGIISIGDASREISKSEKLNEPSEDIPFIRGMDSNGNPIYIGTEQFSSVLAELIGTVTGEKDGLMSKSGFIERGDISDANTRFSGFLRTHGMPNTPYPSEHGILVSISTSSVCLQFFLRGWPVELYWRSLWDNWNSWNRIG